MVNMEDIHLFDENAKQFLRNSDDLFRLLVTSKNLSALNSITYL